MGRNRSGKVRTARVVQVRRFAAGDVIVETGVTDRRLHCIESGVVAIKSPCGKVSSHTLALVSISLSLSHTHTDTHTHKLYFHH